MSFVTENSIRNWLTWKYLLILYGMREVDETQINILFVHCISGQSEKAVGGLSVCDCDRHGRLLFHPNSGSQSSLSEVSTRRASLAKLSSMQSATACISISLIWHKNNTQYVWAGHWGDIAKFLNILLDMYWTLGIFLKISRWDICEKANLLLSCSGHFPELFLPAH